MDDTLQPLIDRYIAYCEVTAAEAVAIIKEDLDTALDDRARQASKGEQP